ncbi:hypothetical protein MtrunA17_Chr6g0481771 [Medicago truncatula]|uniref:Uncharacterized protein n=1 Tax=Medicago truncatula TaxID=3880 RepID=A0A396HJ59_MEDTR|nr:hypothetical protein MtrunA17_Chr6g0481771 [Medicago truncatula]
MNVTWHDTDFTFPRLDDTRTVWSYQSSFGLSVECCFNSYHIMLRNPFSNTNNKIQLSFNRFHNSSSSKRRRNINNRSIRFRFSFRFRNRIENRKP